MSVRYRRSPHVVAYWRDGRLFLHNFALQTRIPASALTVGLLECFADWRAVGAVAASDGLPRDRIVRAVRHLSRHGMLQRSGRAPDPREAAYERWAAWNPSAGLFHAESRHCDFAAGEAAAGAFLADRLDQTPAPPPTKVDPPARAIALPRRPPRGRLAAVLDERRTWRRFGGSRMARADLGTLLDATFGARGWVDLGSLGRAMLRTSPSGGARHPIEAYAAVRRVEGLGAGLYHYSPATRVLSRVQRRPASGGLRRYLPGQPWFADAAVVVFLTAVFARTEWLYPFPRAYRVVLLEAGHFAQTFCLVATALGLAPFCTAALEDDRIERDLGLDGIGEAVLYACGAGTRPKPSRTPPWIPSGGETSSL